MMSARSPLTAMPESRPMAADYTDAQHAVNVRLNELEIVVVLLLKRAGPLYLNGPVEADAVRSLGDRVLARKPAEKP